MMLYFNDSAGSSPAEPPGPGWSWLQERVDRSERREALCSWLADELLDLEAKYADLVTLRSLQSDARQNFNRDR